MIEGNDVYMPTLKDIAKAAGVSHGTVSNVLNAKGNVSVEKIQKVEEVAKRLGYKINHTAKTLRSGATNSVSIILPSIESEEYAQMYEGIDKTLTKLGFRTHLYTTYDLQHNEIQILKEIAGERVTGVITISCLDDADDYYRELSVSKENVFFINRKIKNAKKFITFNFSQAGDDIAKYLSMKRYTSIGIFSDQNKFSNEKQFADSLIKKVNQKNMKIVHSTYNQTYSKAFEFFEKDPVDIIITSSLSKANMIKKAGFWGSTNKIPQILSLAPTQSTYDESMIKYRQNYYLLGSEVAELLINQINNNQKADDAIIIENKGIYSIKNVSKYKSIINLLTIPSPTTNALKKIIPQFQQRTGIEVKLFIKSYDEIYHILSDPVTYNLYDLIRIDMAWLSWFGKDVFHPLNTFDKKLDQIIAEYPNYIKNNYSEIQGVSYAIPFDPSVQMLFFRKDLFEDQKIKRMYFEKFKKELTLPKDYDSYNEIIKFFSIDYFENSPTLYGTSTILGRAEIISAEFLTRYYGEGGTLINKDGEIKLDNKKAVKAIKNYLEMVRISQKLDENWWGEAVNSFAKGETAMILGFMNHISRISHSDIGSLIDFTSVPGSKPLLGGGVIGITKKSDQIEEAISFLNWINETEVAEQITLLGGTSANQKLYDNQMIRMLYPWLEGAIKASFEGIRDTKSKDGRSLNIRRIEQIIGQTIKEILNNKWDIEVGVEKINSRLYDSMGKLILN